jgi:Glycosyltransferases involved in cell wall biogenesis
MASAPLLTVAVAMYQSADTVAHLLESVLSQASNKIEVLIVDDGSTDQSVTVAEAIPTCGVAVRVIKHGSNLGLGPARNTAVAEAKGRYVMFVDSDDEVLPGVLSAITERLESSELDIMFIGTVEHKLGA